MKSKYFDTIVDILDGQFPKRECKERGRALVMLAYIELLLNGTKFDKEGMPLVEEVKEDWVTCDEGCGHRTNDKCRCECHSPKQKEEECQLFYKSYLVPKFKNIPHKFCYHGTWCCKCHIYPCNSLKQKEESIYGCCYEKGKDCSNHDEKQPIEPPDCYREEHKNYQPNNKIPKEP